MKVRVRADAKKGHWVKGELIPPGEELPGDYESVPPTMEHKLELVGGPAEEDDHKISRMVVDGPERKVVVSPGKTAAVSGTVQGEDHTAGEGEPGTNTEAVQKLAEAEKAVAASKAAMEKAASEKKAASSKAASGEQGASTDDEADDESTVDDQPEWYTNLAADLGKDQPTKDDLKSFARSQHGLELDRSMSKADMIAAIEAEESRSGRF